MNGLSSFPADLPDPDDAQVVADGWFPPVALARVRSLAELGGEISTDKLIMAIEGAMLSAFRQLKDWRTGHALAGAAGLADVTTDQLNERNVAVVLWERAVGYYAKAKLFSDTPDISATDKGMDRAEEKACAADEARREAYVAICDILSIGEAEPVQINKVVML